MRRLFDGFLSYARLANKRSWLNQNSSFFANRLLCFRLASVPSASERMQNSKQNILNPRLANVFAWIAIILILVMLLGCHGTKKAVVQIPPALPYKVENSYDKVRMDMRNHFDKNGIKVITLGQEYLISIPSSLLFAQQSPRLTWNSYAVLNDVVCYLKQFRKISVNVTAFSSKCVSSQREHALTLARAQAVGDYLWSQNIDSRFVFTHGLGSDKPILGYRSGQDASPNSRIEITFRDAII